MFLISWCWLSLLELNSFFACPTGYSPYEDLCYQLVLSLTPYSVARTHCAEKGGNLAVVNTIGVRELLKNVAEDQGITGFIWVGMNDQEEEGRWIHDDSSLVTTDEIATLWLSEEPNGGKTENCGAMLGLKWDYQLGDSICSNNQTFFCQFLLESFNQTKVSEQPLATYNRNSSLAHFELQATYTLVANISVEDG
ncbi:C-type lectin domain family 17, member A-like [Tachypleus tridentatus]|uniref:C-type lectin domain family 17, member A-like n=1 Tax=Tachypleus tridentatus TaxID=6853 RepID=UPI003FD185FC